jgi:hypothetical protein
MHLHTTALLAAATAMLFTKTLPTGAQAAASTTGLETAAAAAAAAGAALSAVGMVTLR